MGTNWPKPGLSHVGEDQASGHTSPLTGSANIRYLKYVASSITFMGAAEFVVYDNEHNASEACTVAAGSTFKGKFLTFISTKDCIVELTNIPSGSYAEHNHLSASYCGVGNISY